MFLLSDEFRSEVEADYFERVIAATVTASVFVGIKSEYSYEEG